MNIPFLRPSSTVPNSHLPYFSTASPGAPALQPTTWTWLFIADAFGLSLHCPVIFLWVPLSHIYEYLVDATTDATDFYCSDAAASSSPAHAVLATNYLSTTQRLLLLLRFPAPELSRFLFIQALPSAFDFCCSIIIPLSNEEVITPQLPELLQ